MFLHPKLTPVIGTPHNTMLEHLTKELYANVQAIPSTCSGDGHRHLGLIMPVAEYLVVTGIAFQLPVHPGPTLVSPAGANAAIKQETMHTYKAILKELTIATTFKEEMKNQSLEAVDQLYLAALDNDTFRFSDVTIADMITHLCTTYGPITCWELETNCTSISTVWTPDDPIKTL